MHSLHRGFIGTQVLLPDRLVDSFAEIPSHVLKCTHCPDNVKDALLALKGQHLDQMQMLPRGLQKVFFVVCGGGFMMVIAGPRHLFHNPPLRSRREWIHHHHSLDHGLPLMPPRWYSSLQGSALPNPWNPKRRQKKVALQNTNAQGSSSLFPKTRIGSPTWIALFGITLKCGVHGS